MTQNIDAILTRFNAAQDALVLQAADLSLETIASMVENDAIDVKPTYQRRERWSAEKQRSLIESFLLNVPVPPVYLFEEEYGSYSVIDGKQRITAINLFMRNNLELRDLETFKEIAGMRLDQLPRPIQNALKVRPYLRVVTLLRQSSEYLKYEVFRRLNEGGTPLNAQEIRNAVFRGPLNGMIYELSENKFLRKQMKISGDTGPLYQQMYNAEVVLRFLVLYKDYRKFAGSFRDSMDEFMKERSKLDKKEATALREGFEHAIHACEAVFEEAAFKRPASDGWRDQFLVGMYDAQMVAMSHLSDHQIEKAKERKLDIQRLMRHFFDSDERFAASVREATNTPSRIRYRVEKMLSIITEPNVSSA